MNRFQNEIVMGGSDIDSESEDEYTTGREIYNQYMYNAMMYTSMAQMMPCVPMPYVPPFGYPLPYPPMIHQYPVNHPMAAGTYYRKGGRHHRQNVKSGRNKTRSRLYVERDDVKYKPRHKQHLQSHQYYTSSSESDNDDECPDTRGKGVQACQSVSHKVTADKLKSVDTLGRSIPIQNGQHRLQNRPKEPLSNTINGSYVTGKSGITAACHKMPLSNPDSEKAVMTGNACQQGEHTAELTQTDMHIAACRTMPLHHQGQDTCMCSICRMYDIPKCMFRRVASCSD